MEGDFCFSLPPFSGYKVKKKPLFQWTLEERINEIKIPEKKVKIYKMDILESRFLGKKETKKEILGKVKKIKGDFRQKEIMEKWKEVFRKEDDKEKYLVVKIKVFCSSGCYIRSIADEAGKFLESGAVVLHLKRTRVGEKTLDL